MKKLILTLIVFQIAYSFCSSQCSIIIDPDEFGGKASNAPVIKGQTFVACETGEITSLSVDIWSYSGDYELNIGTPTGEPLDGPPQIFSVSPSEAVQRVLTSITLSTPFPVTSGEMYEYQIRPVANVGWGLGGNGTDPYSQGQCTINGTLLSGPFGRLDFTSVIEINPATPIPTLSQWGVIALSILTMIFGVITIKYSTRFRLQGKQYSMFA